MLVLDSSVTLAWSLDDEENYAPGLLDAVTAAETAVVPMHWLLEVGNGLCMAVRRRRLAPDEPILVLAHIREQPIIIDLETTARGWKEIPALAKAHGLTVYDAAYLELAIRLDAPLATLDQDLARAARAAKVPLFS